MRLEELTSWIAESDDWDYAEDERGLFIRNMRLDTVTHCTFDAIERSDLGAIRAACTQGRDVDHITRVTGYFSKVSGWNRGKAAELRDRSRTDLGGGPKN